MKKKNKVETFDKMNILKIVMSGVLALMVVVALAIQSKKETEDSKPDERQKSTIIEAAAKYMNDTKSTTTSVWALTENGYLESTDEDKCSMIKMNEEIEITEKDCEKAEEIARIPVLQLITSNDFKLDDWNNVGTTISVDFKNQGNSYYKKENIEKITWNCEEKVNSKDNTVEIPDKEMNTTLTVIIEMQDGQIIENSYALKIDKQIPTLDIKDMDKLNVMYQDDSGVEKVYFYINEENNAPTKGSIFVDQSNLNIQCGTKYHVWTYAKDIAGNESDIDYLGVYDSSKNCETINHKQEK